jgi:hypothetical protein
MLRNRCKESTQNGEGENTMSTRINYLGQEMTIVPTERGYLVYIVVQGVLMRVGSAHCYSQAASLGRQEIDAWNRHVNKAG